MSLFEIKNYFLKAGSSFRKSLDWKRRYTDDSGKALVERTGRFGVGVLAAFLIGNEIEVVTRGMNDNTGYSFKALLDTEQIEVLNNINTDIGTTISIRTTLNTILTLVNGSFSWDSWYRLKSPKILFEKAFNPDQKQYHKAYENPTRNEQLSDKWHKIDIDGFGTIHWHYPINSTLYESPTQNGIFRDKPNYTLVNGILIPYVNIFSYPRNKHREILTIPPRVSIFDRDNKLSLTLSRNNIEGELPFINELIEEICKDFLAMILCKIPISHVKGDDIYLYPERIKHPSMRLYFTMYFGEDGFTFNYPYVRKKLINLWDFVKINVSIKKGSTPSITTFKKIHNTLFFSESDDFTSVSSIKDIIDPFYYYGTNGGRIYMKDELYSNLFSPLKNTLRYKLHTSHKKSWQKDKWVAIDYDYDKDTVIDLNNIISNEAIHSVISFSGRSMPYHREDNAAGKMSDILDKIFNKYLGDNVIIPYSLQERKEKFSDAFSDLEQYMRKYI